MTYDQYLNNESDYLDSVGDDREDLEQSRRWYGKIEAEERKRERLRETPEDRE